MAGNYIFLDYKGIAYGTFQRYRKNALFTQFLFHVIATLYTMAANDIFLDYKGIAYGTGKTSPEATVLHYMRWRQTIFSWVTRGLHMERGKTSPEATVYTMTATMFFCITRELHLDRGKLPQRLRYIL